MSNSYLGYPGRSDDVQDGHERHVWKKKVYIEAGSIMTVGGTDTEDKEANNMIGVSDFKLKDDTDSEVILFASSSDTNMKFAVATIPRDKQRRWPEDEGGIQHPIDPEFALHFSKKLAHLTKSKFGVGEKGEFEVRGSDVYIRGRLIVEQEVVANKLVKTPQVVQGKESIPGFEGNKQEEKKQSVGGGGGGATPTQMSFEFDEQFDGTGIA